MNQRRSGFTLIELLVVIAIIAVLIALLVARRAVSTRGGQANSVREQPQADRPGASQLPGVAQRSARGGHGVQRDRALRSDQHPAVPRADARLQLDQLRLFIPGSDQLHGDVYGR